MIQSVTNIDTLIEDVEEITLEDITENTKFLYRVLIVRTKHKENYYLKLQAGEYNKLVLHPHEDTEFEKNWSNLGEKWDEENIP